MSYLAHNSGHGTPHEGDIPHSGRFKWGSGENPHQHEEFFVDAIHRMKKQNPGISDTELAYLLGMSTDEFRKKRSYSSDQRRAYRVTRAIQLKDKGWSEQAIAKDLGVTPTSVRNYLTPSYAEKAQKQGNIREALKKSISEQGCIDVGDGVDLWMGVSKQKFDAAVKALEDEGYKVWGVKVEQLGTGHETNIKVLADPSKVSFKDIKSDPSLIGAVTAYSPDAGKTIEFVQKPVDISSDRIAIRYGDEGGKDRDGVIELRRGVDDISLGGSNYAQVRISVDGTHYLKGMAVYSDDLPDGVDIRFNTNKPSSTPMMVEGSSDGVLKVQKPGDTPFTQNNPFGATIKQRYYIDENGERKLSAINKVNDEGEWADGWSTTLSSQFLSKQTRSLAKKQLDALRKDREEEFEEIKKLTNPAVKRALLEEFASQCDGDAVHLKGAAMPRQAWSVLLPLPEVKPDEIYAPNFNDGERVVLIRYPHAGRFEIPELTVNNKYESGHKILGDQPRDAVGIHPKVALQLSGADFDGDTVLVIPNNSGAIKTHEILKGLRDFDPSESYPAYPGMPKVGKSTGFYKQIEMGEISNLITDMTIKGASFDEIERAVKHSMVVIDAEKHNLNWRKSFTDNRIAELKTTYQGGPRAGASTIVSKAKHEVRGIPDRRAGVWLYDENGKKIYPKQKIDPKTGELLYEETGATRWKKVVDKKTGEESWVKVPKTVSSSLMLETKDANDLSSGTPMEKVYADHANSMKHLANQARLEILNTPPSKMSREARKEYAEEVKSLQDKLRQAQMNAPRERKAQALGNALFRAERKVDPDMDNDTAKKTKARCLALARARTGAGKTLITPTQREWEAIQAGAVAFSTQVEIFKNSNKEAVRRMAMPRETRGLTSSQISRAKAMLSRGASQASVAEALGVSVSTLMSNVQ